MKGKNKSRKRDEGGKPKEVWKPSRRTVASVKALLGYDAMLRSGAAYLGNDLWSVTLRISDVNYLIATQENQLEIIDKWGKFLNSFGGGQSVEVSVSTRSLDSSQVGRAISMPLRGEGLDSWRRDFNSILDEKLTSMSKNSVIDKFVTITIKESDPERATLTLNRLALQAEAQLNAIDQCKAEKLNREERLAVLANTLRPGEPFVFSEQRFLADRRGDTKDYISPWAIDAKDHRMLGIESATRSFFHQSLWIRDFPPELSDRLISDLTDLKADLSVSVHLSPYDRSDGLGVVKRKIAEMDMQRINERRKNVKQHLPADELPQDLEDSWNEASELRDDMQHSNEKLIDSIVVIGVSADTREELAQHVKDVLAVTRGQSCTVETLGYMQPEGLVAELPLGANPLPMRRTLTTSSAAIMIPFTTQEIFDTGANAVFYGTNARSGNAVSVDRTTKMNANGFILGTTGSGKSATGKWEMEEKILKTDDDLVIIDPEREYGPLREAFGGTRIDISAGSRQRINPMDIVFDVDDGSDPIRDKSNTVLAMVQALIGGAEGLDSSEKSVIDRCTLDLYRELRNRPGSPMPTLADLHDRLRASGEEIGEKLALSLELYTTGSLSGFSGQTNVDSSNRLTVYDVHGLSGELQTFGMMVVLDQVWNRIIRNKKLGRRTWLYVDEFHMLFSNEYAAGYFLSIYKRARKYGAAVTGITQNIEELLMNQDARLMLSNSDFLLLMNQTSSDADTLSELLKLSAEQRAFFTGVEPGQGLVKAGTAFIPFDGRIDTGSELYRLNTTKFGE
ncbi:MAG: ATP-binding protein [Bifidobacteriaceae bacterium]|nr:ATP-binding protein [Bifidobacteriaceae bacterium]MCI1935852.1 ATP-binding protein [Bifidobacteriaceae bacterium]